MREVIDVRGVDVKEIVKLAAKDDSFVFLDPPYYIKKKNQNKMHDIEFTPADLLKLKLHCDELTIASIPFLLCNSDCEFVRVLFKDYNIAEVAEPRGIKPGKGKGSRPPEKCVLITNFKKKEDLIDSIKGIKEK